MPDPITDEDTAAGYDYDISILQADFSAAYQQAIDNPATATGLAV